METPKYYQEIDSTLSDHNYELRDKIGQGTFASVYKCKNLKYNEIFCVKAIEILEDKKGLTTSFDSEFQTLVKIIHPNIITLYDYFKSDHYIYLILEYCPNGSLFDIMTKRGEPFSGQELISIIRQVLQAINYIHSIGIAHRDIKPHNILMDSHNRPKLADFGFAQFYNSDLKESHYFNGSFAYMAPELILKHEYSPTAVDILALGVTFYHIASGYLPWYGNNVQREIVSGYFSIPNTFDHKISSLIKAMLKDDPNERPSCSELLEFPLFTKIESKSQSILKIFSNKRLQKLNQKVNQN